MDIIQAINDENLFEPHFKGASWDAWRSFLKAVFALPLNNAELGIYRTATGRNDAPTQPFTEVWTIVGRRGGKSYVLALIAGLPTPTKTRAAKCRLLSSMTGR